MSYDLPAKAAEAINDWNATEAREKGDAKLVTSLPAFESVRCVDVILGGKGQIYGRAADGFVGVLAARVGSLVEDGGAGCASGPRRL